MSWFTRANTPGDGMAHTMDKPFFEVGHFYSRLEIYERLGGDLVSTFTKHEGRVLYCCVSHYSNPDAPDVILVGKQGNLLASAQQLASQNEAVPIFVRHGRKRTQKLGYHGEYVVEQLSQDREQIRWYSSKAYRLDVKALLFMRRVK